MRKQLLPMAGFVVALIVVAAGSATASSLITAHQLGTGSVTSRAIHDGAIHESDLSPRLQHKIDGAETKSNFIMNGLGFQKQVDNLTCQIVFLQSEILQLQGTGGGHDCDHP